MIKLLDLYCCGGGASLGYEQAGFDVTGIDIESQPHYKGKFVQADALQYLADNHSKYDVFHASPPCQAYSLASMQFREYGKEYPDLIAATREILMAVGKPYVIENVPHSPLLNPVLLCGLMFEMQTYRHRLFESNFVIVPPPHLAHVAKNAKMGRVVKEGEYIQYVGHFSGVPKVREMTGLYWLNQYELAQSIPPQYTNFVGKQLLKSL